jgi:D-apiose dehydrogenase
MRPPRVAIVGAGYFAQFHIEAWHRLAQQGHCAFVGIADLDQVRTAAAAKQTGAKAYVDARVMLDSLEVDLLDIATPPATHAALVGLALEKRIPAICQKPLAPTLAEAESLAAQVAASAGQVWVHENFRWMPWYRAMRAALESGLLGKPHGMTSRIRPGDGQGPDAYLARQPYFQTMPRFLVHETLIHLIDTYRYLFGDVVAVQAQLRRLNPAIAGEDAGIVSLRFANGAVGLIDANRCNDHSADNTRLTMGEAWLEGSAGVMRLDGYANLFFKPHQSAEHAHAYSWNNQGFGGDCVYHQQLHVLNALAGREMPVNLVGDYLTNIRIEEAVYQAHDERREVALA